MSAALTGALRAHAAGLYPDEAGTELLICHGGILPREDFAGFVHAGTSISDGSTLLAWIDWDAALSALHHGRLPLSGGEQRILTLAASIAAGTPPACATPSPAWITGTWSSWSQPSATPPDAHQDAADHHQRRPGRETSRACSASTATPQSLPDARSTQGNWHRDLLARRHAARSRPKRPGRPRTVRSIRQLVLRLARENPCWGYRRIHGELLVLGIKVAASTVWEILQQAGIDPAPGRTSATWASFLHSQAEALIACDFFETVTLTGTRLHVLAVIEHATRRIRILGATPHPTASWVAQAARNLVMDLEDAGSRARFLIRDRDGKFPSLFDAILADAGVEVVLSGVQMPRMNSIMERWVQTCRRELLDRTLIWNQAHLLRALREFEQFYNAHRPHQGIANARPLRALPPPITEPGAATRLHIRRRDRLGGILHEYRHAA